MASDGETLTGRLGRYELVGELGRGGMGRVLRGLDPEIGREVAIKVLLDESGADRESLERFVAEARITGQLEHPNIVPVYDAGITEDGRVYYVMRLIAGQDLGAVLDAGAPDWGQHRLLSAFASVCDAVAYAHHRGVLHQDIKPQNIVLGAFGEVLVVDWGLATLVRAGLRVAWERVRTSGLVGTPGLIPPERILASCEAPTALADQWSLGATLYTLLCRKPPYEGTSSRALLEATLRGAPEDVRLRNPDIEVPHGLGEICARAMDPDPDRRYPDVAALAAAIRDFQEGSERRARALLKVAEADGLAPQIAARREAAAALKTRAATLLQGVKGSDPVARKREAWSLQDGANAALASAELDQIVWEHSLQGALQLVPDLHEAHVRLAAHHRRALERAEQARDADAAGRAEWLLRQHDRGHHRRWLAGMGALSLVTDPPGAHARLRRFELQDRRLVPGEARDLGPTPLIDLPLAPGSYLVELSHPGCAPVRYPIVLRRAERWDGVAPGDTEPHVILLPREHELDRDDLYVPAGWFQAGGDADAPDALPARRVWVDGFLCRKYPVTNAEYAVYLNKLLALGQSEDAELCVPRDIQRPAHALDGRPTFGRDAAGRFVPPAGEDPSIWASLPVTGVDLASARRFAEDGGWRLPDELEREKAARGVDGRFFPWGDHFDPAFSNIAASQHLPRRVPVTDFPFDESVYGICGLAGNLRDLCGNAWTEDGPAQDGERLILRPAALTADFISVRGGSWSSTTNLARAAARFGDEPPTRQHSRGIRLFRSFG